MTWIAFSAPGGLCFPGGQEGAKDRPGGLDKHIDSHRGGGGLVSVGVVGGPSRSSSQQSHSRPGTFFRSLRCPYCVREIDQKIINSLGAPCTVYCEIVRASIAQVSSIHNVSLADRHRSVRRVHRASSLPAVAPWCATPRFGCAHAIGVGGRR